MEDLRYLKKTMKVETQTMRFIPQTDITFRPQVKVQCSFL